MKFMDAAPGIVVIGVGGFAFVHGALTHDFSAKEMSLGVIVMLVGLLVVSGFDSIKIATKNLFDIEARRYSPERIAPPKIEPRVLDPKVIEKRRAEVDETTIPGANAAPFSIVSDSLPLATIPWTDPMVPAYILNCDYRIVDWNDAFSLAFERTMDGRRGRSVLEWVFVLDNWKAVVKHAKEVFGGQRSKLPTVDVEQIEYTNQRIHGRIIGTKRTYQIPGDDSKLIGWLTTVELRFPNDELTRQFRLELARILSRELLWSEYALLYDAVLGPTETYQKLLSAILGEGVGHVLQPIAPSSRVLDLGAGTGNITIKLATSQKQLVVFAVENNRAMLQILRSKCRAWLKLDDSEPGVLAVKQDATSLYGIQDNYFQYALLNNVLYSVSDPIACLKEVYRVLSPGGEVRITGPQRSTNLAKLFGSLERDLKNLGLLTALQDDFERVRAINTYLLAPMLFKWTTEDVEKMLLESGFSRIAYSTNRVYAGQAMLICAIK